MHGCMVKNYKLQNTNHKQITNYNVQNYNKSGALRANSAWWPVTSGQLFRRRRKKNAQSAPQLIIPSFIIHNSSFKNAMHLIRRRRKQ